MINPWWGFARCLAPQVMRNKSGRPPRSRKKLLSDIPINDDYPTPPSLKGSYRSHLLDIQHKSTFMLEEGGEGASIRDQKCNILWKIAVSLWPHLPETLKVFSPASGGFAPHIFGGGVGLEIIQPPSFPVQWRSTAQFVAMCQLYNREGGCSKVYSRFHGECLARVWKRDPGVV